MSEPATEDDILKVYTTSIDGLYAFVARRCSGDRDLAEDIVQETWLRAVKAWHARGIPDTPAAWLTTVARNLLRNHVRRLPHDPLDETLVAATTRPDRSAEQQSLLTRALGHLSVPHQRLLRAFHFDRQPVAHIAADHGISERAVEGRLRRARQQLRRQVESDPDHEGES
ncbi:MAG TPA: sigma-70 family RNA polymerase sigma factor [Gemmatimonadales bacterium]|jgi:RNA polymerase sigma-70 factor (ECF subfamily)